MMRRQTMLTIALVVALGATIGGLAAQQERAGTSKGKATADRQDQQQGLAFPGLVEAIKKTPGCLGVEMGQVASGKNVIFAWFKDKESCVAWYESEMHQAVMDRFFPEGQRRGPLVDVPDDVGPIMAIASITPAKAGQFQETQLPISQISIELYTPVTGGLSLGGTFAPKGLKVMGARDYSAKK